MAKRKSASRTAARAKPKNLASSRARPLVIERLEMVSKALFKEYSASVEQIVGSSHGIYALYDGEELYYVGKSKDLRRRVKAHLKDRHLASWSHFSLYLVRNADYLDDIESLLIRIADPRGNRVKPKGTGDAKLRGRLRKLIQEQQKKSLKILLPSPRKPGRAAPKGAGKKAAASRKRIVGLVDRRTQLYREYKGQTLKAVLTPAGKVVYEGTEYSSPTAAAKAATGRRSLNGWTFWYAKDSEGVLLRLREFATRA